MFDANLRSVITNIHTYISASVGDGFRLVYIDAVCRAYMRLNLFSLICIAYVVCY